MGELFSLENKSYPSSLASSLSTLQTSSMLCDCILVCSDGQLSAHKVILAAASSFFSSVLTTNHHNHPLIYLWGVKISQVEAILAYIYQGRTQVTQEELPTFLALVEDLKIRGLVKDIVNVATEEIPDSMNKQEDQNFPHSIGREANLSSEENITNYQLSNIDSVDIKSNEDESIPLNLEMDSLNLDRKEVIKETSNIIPELNISTSEHVKDRENINTHELLNNSTENMKDMIELNNLNNVADDYNPYNVLTYNDHQDLLINNQGKSRKEDVNNKKVYGHTECIKDCHEEKLKRRKMMCSNPQNTKRDITQSVAECPVCGVKSVQRSFLKAHMNAKREGQCPDCKLYFQSCYSILIHKRGRCRKKT